MAPAERDRLPPGSVVMYAATQSESPVEERAERARETERDGESFQRLCGSITFLSRSIRTLEYLRSRVERVKGRGNVKGREQPKSSSPCF